MNGLRVANVGRLLCIAGAALGALGLFGWIAGEPFLTTIVPGQPSMKPNTALALLLLGAAGALRQRQGVERTPWLLSVAAAIVVFGIGAGTLAEYALARDLHIDHIALRLVGEADVAAPYPGRPSPPTALALALLAAALLLFDLRLAARARPSEWLILTALLIAFVALVGLVFGAGPLYRLTNAPVTGVSLPTAVSLVLICAGLLLERRDAGVMRVVTSAGAGGIMLRRLATPAVLAPVLLGLFFTRFLAKQGVEDLPLLLAALSIALTAITLLLLTVTAPVLDRTQQDLEASRARLRDIFDQASDGIFVADVDGRYTDVNRAGCRLLGLERAEIIGKTVFELMPPADAERLAREKEKLLAGETVVSEWTPRRKDGTLVPVEVSARIVADGRWQAFARDVSERRRLEAELRHSLAQSSGILSISADAIICIDANQRITMFNDGAERIFGHSKAAAIGQPLEQLIPERFRAAHRVHVQRFAAGSESARRMGERGAAIFGLRKDGEEFPADGAISKLEVAGETIFTVAIRDISEQKRIEDEERFLAEVGSVLAATLDYEETLKNIAELVVKDLTDVCIIETLREDAGQTVGALTVTHRDSAEVGAIAALWSAAFDPRRSLCSQVLGNRRSLVVSNMALEAIESTALDDEHRKALRELRAQSLLALPMIAHGRMLGTMVLVSTTATRLLGVDDLPLAEEIASRAAMAVENARLYRDALRATQARDDLLGIVAHDLRNPLSAIVIEAECLRRLETPLNPTSSESVRAIERAASRMKHLIDDLLDLTRLEAGRLSVEEARVTVRGLVVDCVEAQKPLAAAANLELTLHVEARVPDVWGDRGRLLQVLDNLVGNAVKFTAPGGRITVEAARAAEYVRFSVSDSGAGILPEELPHVFDRFWQSRKTKRTGAGLGLPIVKGIVEAHGGRVWVESTPGRGSTFSFTIPVVQLPQTTLATPRR